MVVQPFRVAGFIVNLLLWKFAPGVSWLWWNVIGCAVTAGVGYTVSLLTPGPVKAGVDDLVWHRDTHAYFQYQRRWPRYHLVLVLYFIAMLGVLWAVQKALVQ